jgi:hypothetical protein
MHAHAPDAGLRPLNPPGWNANFAQLIIVVNDSSLKESLTTITIGAQNLRSRSQKKTAGWPAPCQTGELRNITNANTHMRQPPGTRLPDFA